MTTQPTRASRAFSFVIAISLLVPIAASAQGRRAPADGTAVPRTAWGDPDLQGIWDYWTFTPLERPAEFSDRDVLTTEEAAVVARQSNEEALARDAPPPPGQVGGYSQAVWTDRARATALTQPSLLVDPPDGKLPPLTPQAQHRAEAHRAAGGHPVRLRVGGLNADGPEARGVSERCVLGFSTGPPMLPAGYNNNVQLFQTPGYIVILHEMVHDARIIPLDGRAPLPPQRPPVARELPRSLGGGHPGR